MKKEVAYVVGYLDGADIVYIGWNNSTDYYDAILADYFDTVDTKYFIETTANLDTVYVYRFSTKEEASAHLTKLQREFREKLSVIKIVQEDADYWCPEDTVDDSSDNNKGNGNKDIAKNLIRLTKQEAYDLAIQNGETPKFAEYLAKTHLWFRTNAIVDGKKEQLYISFIHKPAIATTLYYRDDTAAPTVNIENFKAYNHKYNNEYPSWSKMLQAIDEGLNSPLSKQKHETVEAVPELYEKCIGFGSTLVVPHIILHKTVTTDIYRTHISFYINDSYFAGAKDKQIAIVEFDEDTLKDLRNILVELMNNFDKRLDSYFKRYRNNISTYGYWADR